MGRWRRLARKQGKLLICAQGGTTLHGETLVSGRRFLAVHPSFERVVVPDPGGYYVEIGDSMSFSVDVSNPPDYTDDQGYTYSTRRSVEAVGMFINGEGEPFPYRDPNGKLISADLNSHGYGFDRQFNLGYDAYWFNANVVLHVVITRSRGSSTRVDSDRYLLRTATAEVRYHHDVIPPWLEYLPPLLTGDSLATVGGTPPVTILGGGQESVEYREVDDDDFPDGIDYRRS